MAGAVRLPGGVPHFEGTPQAGKNASNRAVHLHTISPPLSRGYPTFGSYLSPELKASNQANRPPRQPERRLQCMGGSATSGRLCSCPPWACWSAPQCIRPHLAHAASRSQ